MGMTTGESAMAQKRCPYCKKWFKANLRKGGQQITCCAPECRRKHKLKWSREWHRKDPAWAKCRYPKVNARMRATGYWKGYLLRNPECAERNRLKTRERMRRKRAEQRNSCEVMRDPLGYLEGLRDACGVDVCKPGLGGAISSTRGGPTAEDVCKPGLGEGAVVGIVRYLIAKEVFANQDAMAGTGAARV